MFDVFDRGSRKQRYNLLFFNTKNGLRKQKT